MTIKNKFYSLILLSMFWFPSLANSKERAVFYPEIQPFKTGFLKVSDIHEIYYELSGSPKGKPVVFLHGGPGAASSPTHRRYFDPKKFLIILFDQRGCGKSRPLAETRQNTPQALVEDIEKLRRHLKLGKIMLVGGSWGSTLGIAYAETYPKNVEAMIFRATFLATSDELHWAYHSDGPEKFFPGIYQETVNAISTGSKSIDYKKLYSLLKNKDKNISKKFADLWVKYELTICSFDASEKEIEELVKHIDTVSFATLETNYVIHNYFLKKNQLLKNIDKIKDIPLTLIQGQYDIPMPPVMSYNLHKLLPKSKLITVTAGHFSLKEDRLNAAFIEAVKEYESPVL